MFKKLSFVFLITILGISFTACGSEEVIELQEITDPQEVTELETEIAALPEGEIPYEFPVLETTSKDGEYILAPAREYLDEAIELGAEDASFIFFVNKMISSGEKESTINDVNDVSDDVLMPNSLIITLPAGQTAEAGDIILTWWQSLAGMQRAMVIEGGSPSEPMVKYLDSGIDYETEQIEANSFLKLTEEWQVGTSIAVLEDDLYIDEQIISMDGEKILTLGFAGSIHVRNKTNAKPVPIIPNLQIGDEVYVPIIDSYEKVTVTDLDHEQGVVTVTYEWAGDTEIENYGYGSIMTEL